MKKSWLGLFAFFGCLSLGSLVIIPDPDRSRYKEYSVAYNFIYYYLYFPTPRTYREAYVECEGENAMLLVPKFESQFNFLHSKHPELTTKQVWIGIHSIYAEQDFVTVNSDHIKTVNLYWAAGDPDRTFNTTKRCVAVQNGVFYTADCQEKKGYICYRNHMRNEFVINCEWLGEGYTPYFDNSGCFKVQEKPLTWKWANKECHKDGGRLPYLTSQKLANQLVRAIRPVKERYRRSNQSKNKVDFEHYHAGFTTHLTRKVNDYTYSNGRTTGQVGYNKKHVNATFQFYHRKPPAVVCGTFNDKDTELNNHYCDMFKNFFACEKVQFGPLQFSYHVETDNTGEMIIAEKYHSVNYV